MKCLLPIRLGLLLTHLVLCVMLLSSRDLSVRLCIDWDYTAEEYHSKDTELLVGLILSIVLLVLECISFLSGISMLHSKQTLFSCLVHGLGTGALASFMWDGWQCGIFWCIFLLTIVVPVLTEMWVLVRLSVIGDAGQWRHRVQT